VPFHKLEIPTGKDVCRKQFYHFMDKLLSLEVNQGDYEAYVPMLEEKFAEMSKEEILKRVAALEFDRFLKYYENAEDLNVREQRRGERGTGERIMVRKDGGGDRRQFADRGAGGRKFGGGGGDYTKLFVNLGTKDGFYKASFLQFILDMSELQKEVLGRIDMKEMNSWIEIDKRVASQMIRSIDGKNYKGRRIRMNEADSRR
jgi:ATP-dependent RNA helicase DeaD